MLLHFFVGVSFINANMALHTDSKQDADDSEMYWHDQVVDSKEATADDRRDMLRLGKAQEMKVHDVWNDSLNLFNLAL